MSARFCVVLFVGLLALSLFGCSGQKSAQAPSGPLPPVYTFAPVEKPTPESVFFATDKSDITPQAAVALKNQAEWLKQHPDTKMQITGNADQRASQEYNQALGQKRADAVKDYLVQLGVNADRLETASYGAARPVCTESEENCYAANRRADLRAIG